MTIISLRSSSFRAKLSEHLKIKSLSSATKAKVGKPEDTLIMFSKKRVNFAGENLMSYVISSYFMSFIAVSFLNILFKMIFVQS